MSTHVRLPPAYEAWERPEKNRMRERRSSAALMKAVKWVSIASLIVAGLFGVLAALYHPVPATFRFSGGWQHVLVLASVVTFVAALASPDRRLKRL